MTNTIADVKRMIDIKGKNDCWIYKGKPGQYGYALMRFEGKKRRVHRIVYEYFYGLSDHDSIHHRCRNKLCCNPDHMEIMSNSEHTKLEHSFPTEKYCIYGHDLHLRLSGEIVCKKCNTIRQWNRRHPNDIIPMNPGRSLRRKRVKQDLSSS